MFLVRFSASAVDDLRFLKKNEQQLVIDEAARQLGTELLTPTRNRKPLRPNVLSGSELRGDRLRVFYDVGPEGRVVTIKAVGWKEHNTLYIRGREFPL
jgi:mRNA-degrading endonuclease RelE of RelBE toxin-antitoxin system